MINTNFPKWWFYPFYSHQYKAEWRLIVFNSVAKNWSYIASIRQYKKSNKTKPNKWEVSKSVLFSSGGFMPNWQQEPLFENIDEAALYAQSLVGVTGKIERVRWKPIESNGYYYAPTKQE